MRRSWALFTLSSAVAACTAFGATTAGSPNDTNGGADAAAAHDAAAGPASDGGAPSADGSPTDPSACGGQTLLDSTFDKAGLIPDGWHVLADHGTNPEVETVDTPWGATGAQPATPPVAHMQVSAPGTAATAGGRALLTFVSPSPTFSHATLGYDFAWHAETGYAEFGCLLRYESDGGNSYASIELRRDTNPPANAATAGVFAAVTSQTGRDAGAMPFSLTAPPAVDTYHHMTETLAVTAEGYVFTIKLDDNPAQTAPSPVALESTLTDLEIDCGVHYVDSGDGPPHGAEVAIDNVKLTTCP